MSDSGVQTAIAAVLELYDAIDSGDVQRAVNAFTEDATYETTMGTSSGRQEITRFFQGRIDVPGRRSVHVVANARGRVLQGSGVEVAAVLLLYRADPDAPPSWRLERVVPAVHRLLWVDGAWLIAERSNPALR